MNIVASFHHENRIESSNRSCCPTGGEKAIGQKGTCKGTNNAAEGTSKAAKKNSQEKRKLDQFIEYKESVRMWLNDETVLPTFMQVGTGGLEVFE